MRHASPRPCLLLGCLLAAGSAFAAPPEATLALDRQQLDTYLLDAARAGEHELVAALIEAGVDPETRSDDGHTALTLAAYAGQLEAVDGLLVAGADPNTADARGNTPLMGAIFRGEEAIVQRLLADPRTEVDARNAAGQTAVMFAAMFDRTAVIDLLQAHGADLDLADASGRTAEHVARQQGNHALAERIAGPGAR